MMDKGIYCLIFRNPRCTVRVGALGEVAFPAGYHIYVGSALGPGGLARLERHIRLAKGRDRRPTWHVDHLLTDPRFSLISAVWAPTYERLECSLARALGNPGIPAFGCSDCSCGSHLLFRDADPRREIVRACRRLGLDPVIKTIITHQVNGTI